MCEDYGRKERQLEDGLSESRIEKIFTDTVKRTGGRAYKWVSPGNAGVPDRIVIFPGKRPVFVELKTSRGRLTKLQETQLKRLAGLGQEVEVLYGLAGVAKFFFWAGYQEEGRKLAKRCGLAESSLTEAGGAGNWNS